MDFNPDNEVCHKFIILLHLERSQNAMHQYAKKRQEAPSLHTR